MTEWTCKCIADLTVDPKYTGGQPLEFIKGHEYQVDIYPLYYKVYANGGWDDYEHFSDDVFRMYFELIKF